MNWLQYVLGVAWLMVLLVAWPMLGHAKRVALVFGSNEYAQLDDLSKAVNDATAMSQEFTAAGFVVVNKDLYKNLTRQQMLDARDSLFNTIATGDQVVVFYSGHGLQIGSNIFLVPVSFPRSASTAERIMEESMALQTVMDGVRERIGETGFALYIIDACRNNPLPKTAQGRVVNMSGRGITTVPPPSGQIAIYAASNGQTALDALEDNDPDPNGVFTRVLLKHLRVPNRPIMEVLADVQEEVVQLAKRVWDPDVGRWHEQQPAVHHEARLKNPFCLHTTAGGCGQAATTTSTPVVIPPSTSVDAKTVELEFWRSVDKTDAEQVQEYLDTYPNGAFAKLARRIVRRLAATPPVVAAAKVENVPPVVEPEPPVRDFEPEMVDIPAGSFKMGSLASEKDHESNENLHKVTVGAFKMGKYEVTRGQFRAFVDAAGYKTEAEHGNGCYSWTGATWENKQEYYWLNVGFTQDDNDPVVCVSLNDAMTYALWLSTQTGKRFRLPTEAEWEYAARAGTSTARFWGDDPNQSCQYANVADQSAKQRLSAVSVIHECDDGYEATSPVGQFMANKFELYDMLGNVWEWTCSVYDYSYNGNENRCDKQVNRVTRSLRGGSWVDVSNWVRAAARPYHLIPSYRDVTLGFRVVQD